MPVNETLRVLKTLPHDERQFSLYLSAGTIGRVAKPGHFAMIRAGDGLRPYLRRAFSIAGVLDLDGAPALEFVIKVVGAGTRALGEMAPGKTVEVLGPLGTPFPVEDLEPGRAVALVAGGIGLAPLLGLARNLAARGIQADLFYGGRTLSDVLKRAEFGAALGSANCHYATDDGTFGTRGLVTDVMAEALRSQGRRYRRVYACGPLPMLRALASLLDGHRIEASFAFETEMACGFGACLGCVLPSPSGGFLTLCREGPCLPPAEVDWNLIR